MVELKRYKKGEILIFILSIKKLTIFVLQKFYIIRKKSHQKLWS